MQLKNIVATLAVAAALTPFAAGADTYPTRPIKVLVGYGAAGAGDTVSRIVGEQLSKKLGQSFIVENKPGAGGTIAANLLNDAPADGYTLGVMPVSVYGIDQYMYGAKYKGTDFTPIAKLASYPLVLVVDKSLNTPTLEAFVEKLKANPGKYNYSTSGVAGSPHAAALMFLQATGTDAVDIPFKGGADALVAVASSQVQFSFATPASVVPVADRVDALAVSSIEPSPLSPGLPTIADSGFPGFDISYWFALFGPGKLPEDITDKLATAVGEVLQDPEIKAKLINAGLDPAAPATPKEFAAFAEKDGKEALDRIEQFDLKK